LGGGGGGGFSQLILALLCDRSEICLVSPSTFPSFGTYTTPFLPSRDTEVSGTPFFLKLLLGVRLESTTHFTSPGCVFSLSSSGRRRKLLQRRERERISSPTVLYRFFGAESQDFLPITFPPRFFRSLSNGDQVFSYSFSFFRARKGSRILFLEAFASSSCLLHSRRRRPHVDPCPYIVSHWAVFSTGLLSALYYLIIRKFVSVCLRALLKPRYYGPCSGYTGFLEESVSRRLTWRFFDSSRRFVLSYTHLEWNPFPFPIG